MKLSINGIKEQEAWKKAGIALPGYDVEAASENAKENPVWVHFGIGNIFRVFIGGIADGLRYVNGRVPLLIELKLPDSNMKLCPAAWDILKDYKGPYMVQSFNSLGIRWFHKHAPQVLRGQLSSALTRTNPENPFLARFCVQFLLTNLICRPDFISYKLADAGNPSVWLNHYLYRIPMAVWTLRNQKAYKTARNKYDMYIFEGFSVK